MHPNIQSSTAVGVHTVGKTGADDPHFCFLHILKRVSVYAHIEKFIILLIIKAENHHPQPPPPPPKRI